jgi:hypothetical protein
MKYIINEDQNKRLYRQSDEFKNAFLEVLKDSWTLQIKNGEDPYIDKSFYNMFGVEFNSNISENYVFPEFRKFIGGDEIALEQVKRLGEKTYSTDTRYDAGTYDFTFNFEVDDTSKIDYGVVDVRIKNLEGTVDIDGVEHIIPDVMKSDDNIGWEVGYEVFDIINDILNDEVVPYVGYQLTTY